MTYKEARERFNVIVKQAETDYLVDCNKTDFLAMMLNETIKRLDSIAPQEPIETIDLTSVHGFQTVDKTIVPSLAHIAYVTYTNNCQHSTNEAWERVVTAILAGLLTTHKIELKKAPKCHIY